MVFEIYCLPERAREDCRGDGRDEDGLAVVGMADPDERDDGPRRVEGVLREDLHPLRVRGAVPDEQAQVVLADLLGLNQVGVRK